MPSSSCSAPPLHAGASGLGLAALVVATTCVGVSVSFAPSSVTTVTTTSASAAHAILRSPRTCYSPRSQPPLFGNPPALSPTRRYSAVNGGNNDGGEDDDDDASDSDSFDPLRSPHEYPGGIDAGAPSAQSQSQGSASSPAAADAAETSAAAIRDDDVDDDSSFDPFLTSPHDFPSAVSSSASASASSSDERSFGFDVAASAADGSTKEDVADVDDDDWSPLRGAIKVERFEDEDGISSSSVSGGNRNNRVRLTSDWAVPSATSSAPADAYYQKQKAESRDSGGTTTTSGGGDPDADLFDPRLSPHVYSKGIPDGSSSGEDDEEQAAEAEKVGVLLIDHGSRRASSNDRLLELAAAYDERSPDHYVVRAAHMEIAPPTIEDGIRALLEADEGVSRIVCHPYFLSPGRHVQEDIPQLVSEAIAKLDRPDVPVVTTDPVGSSLDVMVDAIGALVDETVREISGAGGQASTSRPTSLGQERRPAVEDEYKLGGFFGEVQRMVDEQLD